MWVGLSLVYSRSCLTAIRWGPNRKPSYTVTRKHQVIAWYWRETLPQAVLVVGLCGAVIYAVVTEPLLTKLDLGSIYWACFSIVLLGTFLRKSWFGREPRADLLRKVARWRTTNTIGRRREYVIDRRSGPAAPRFDRERVS